MENDLIAVLEEKYELKPGTLEKYHSSSLAMDPAEVERMRREKLQQEQDEAALAEADPNTLSHRDRLYRLFQYYEPHYIPQIDLLLFKHEGEEEALIQEMRKKIGGGSMIDEPANDVRLRFRLLKFYDKYNPSKRSEVDAVMTRFRGRESHAIKLFILKYGGEPPDPKPIPLPPPPVLDYRRSVRKRLYRIYSKHAPEKLPQVRDILEKYEGFEEDLLDQLDEKYDNVAAEDLFEDPKKLQMYREKLEDIYRRHNVLDKLDQIDVILKKYRGHEKNLFEQLAVKYPDQIPQTTVDDGDEERNKYSRRDNDDDDDLR